MRKKVDLCCFIAFEDGQSFFCVFARELKMMELIKREGKMNSYLI